MEFKQKNVFALTTLLLVILSLEMILRLFCVLWPKQTYAIFQSPVVFDQKLGFRPNPANPEHDQKGFRNEYVPAIADIVAMGDSQTYGTGVSRNQAWPQQLADKTRLKVYSMAYGGYGPVHYLLLFEEAAALAPKMIIETFYAGNDLYNAYSMVHSRGQYSQIKSTNQEVLASIQRLEANEPLGDKIRKLSSARMDEKKSHPDSWFGAIQFFFKNSKLYKLGQFLEKKIEYNLYARKNRVPWSWASEKEKALKKKSFFEVFESNGFYTLFTPAYRFLALNSNDLRIEEGFRISLEAIKLFSKKCASRKIRYIALLIPTKELVFKEAVNFPKASKSYAGLVREEESMWLKTKTFLEKQGIDYLDALPALKSALRDGKQPYQKTSDGHPNALGQEQIASLLCAHLKQYYEFLGEDL